MTRPSMVPQLEADLDEQRRLLAQHREQVPALERAVADTGRQAARAKAAGGDTAALRARRRDQEDELRETQDAIAVLEGDIIPQLEARLATAHREDAAGEESRTRAAAVAATVDLHQAALTWLRGDFRTHLAAVDAALQLAVAAEDYRRELAGTMAMAPVVAQVRQAIDAASPGALEILQALRVALMNAPSQPGPVSPSRVERTPPHVTR